MPGNGRDRTGSIIQHEVPELGQQVRPLRNHEVPPSLAVRLTPVVDRIRQLYTRFGIRPYRVFLVHVIWTGPRVLKGDGEAIEISKVELLPTPRVLDMTATNQVLKATGLTEEGGITIDQISAKYSEDDLMGRTPDLQDPALLRTSMSNAEFFWEVLENRPTNPNPIPRMYVPSVAPALSRDGFQWKVVLLKRDFDRSRLKVETPRRTF